MCIALKFIDVIQYIPHGQREKKIAANFYAMIERPASPIYIDSFNIDTVYVFFFHWKKSRKRKSEALSHVQHVNYGLMMSVSLRRKNPHKNEQIR